MFNSNPYAAPAGDDSTNPGPVEPEKRIWRRWKWLVLERGAALPERCVKCNRSNDVVMITKRFNYSSFNLAISSKATTVAIGICKSCQRRCRRAKWRGLFLGAAGLVLMATGIAWKSMFFALPGVLALAAGIAMAYRAQLVVVSRIDRKTIRLAGFCREYLSELPSGR